MQETNINFTGLALTPYSDISPDGQLSVCAGLEFHGGALRPSILGGTKYTLPDDGNSYRLVHIHTTSAYSHFILAAGDSVYWADVAEGELFVSPVGTFTGFSSANSVGNTLVILTSGGLHYSLWKEGSYKYIGQQPPEIDMSFGLDITTYDRMSDSGSITLVPEGEYTETTHTNRLVISAEENQREYITDVVWGAVNRVMEACSENNRFCMPFFVRAAYRRFDGSYTMLTPPVLMIPDSVGPKALMTFDETEAEKITGKVYGRAWAGLLEALIPSSFAAAAGSWSDIISSVDIFVSPQVMRADSSEIITSMYGYPQSGEESDYPPTSYCIGRSSGATSVHTRLDFDWYLSSSTMKYFKLHYKEEGDFLQDLNGNLQFYKVRSLSVGQLAELASGSFFPVMEKSMGVSGIVQQESLPDSDDYQSHDSLSALRSHVYNQRLHLFSMQRTLFAGFKPENSWSYTNDGSGGTITVSVFVPSEDGDTRVVKVRSSDFNPSQLGRFLYYPDARASRMIITGGGFSVDVPLQPHPSLNGAYYIFMDTEPYSSSVAEPSEANRPISMANKVYASEVGNPFHFPLEGIYTVGTGEIYGLSSVATALSQGQFGQFPLMVFCSDGNYAMSVNAEGRYSAIHPVQRDVCVNPDAIVQTDSDMLFISSRGVMVTSGAGANCISSELDGVPDQLPPEFDPWIYPHGHPSDFFRSCRVAYDYTNRRIIFFPASGLSCYIYSIDSAFWSSAAFGSIVTSINVFPYSYIQVDGRRIYMLSDAYRYEGAAVEGLLYTRPVKMGTLQMKRLLRMSLHGTFSSRQKITVYVSNDCRTWHCIGTSVTDIIDSLRGRPAKYWRFAVQTSIGPSENISSLRLHFEPRKERRLR